MKRVASLIFALALFAGCSGGFSGVAGGAVAPIPPPASSSAPIHTPLPSPTHPPSPTPTAMPTVCFVLDGTTCSPSPTPTAAPTASPSPLPTPTSSPTPSPTPTPIGAVGPLSCAPCTINIGNTNPAVATFTVTDTNYAGAFSESDNCTGIATVFLTSSHAYTVTMLPPPTPPPGPPVITTGTCLATISDTFGNAASVTINATSFDVGIQSRHHKRKASK